MRANDCTTNSHDNVISMINILRGSDTDPYHNSDIAMNNMNLFITIQATPGFNHVHTLATG